MLLAGCGRGQKRSAALEDARDLVANERAELVHVGVHTRGHARPEPVRKAGGSLSIASARRHGYPLSIEEAFAIAESWIDGDVFDVKYEPTYGYPVTMSVDLDTHAVDDEMGFGVRSFAPTDS